MKAKRLSTKQSEDVLYLYWLMLQSLEHKLDPKTDLLDKNEVEVGYRTWNRIHHSDLQPYWAK